jgi:hypothetical protein
MSEDKVQLNNFIFLNDGGRLAWKRGDTDQSSLQMITQSSLICYAAAAIGSRTQLIGLLNSALIMVIFSRVAAL